MQDILYLAGSNAKVAEQVRETITADRPSYSLRQMFDGEMILDIETMNLMRRTGPRSLFTMSGESQAKAQEMAKPFEQSRPGRSFWKLLTDAGEADILRRRRWALAIAQRPYAERQRLWKQWDDSIEDRSAGAVGVFAAMTMAPPRWGDEKTMAIRAQEQVVVNAAAALAYKARHGQWPDRLEQIDP
jgi:hypothetical protein